MKKKYSNQDMKKPSCLSMEEWIKRMYMHSEILPRHEKEGKSAICNNTDEHRRQYVKWNKPEEEKYCMLSLMLKKKIKLIETESKLVTASNLGE